MLAKAPPKREKKVLTPVSSEEMKDWKDSIKELCKSKGYEVKRVTSAKSVAKYEFVAELDWFVNKNILIKINQLLTEIENHPLYTTQIKKDIETTIINIKQKEKVNRKLFQE